jgi:hypothetical protein
MITQVRVAYPQIMLGGMDYYSSLAPYFLNLVYTDNYDGEKADDLDLQLADRDRRFINDWMPDKGVFVDVSIITERWFSPGGSLSLDCGRFWIDTVDFELPQHTVSVKASSIPTDIHIKSKDETRGWEDTSLQDITGQIAEENQMEVQWESDYNPQYERVEQTEENGLCFLKKRAKDVGLTIKVARNKIIVSDAQQMDAAAPSFTLVYGNVAGGGGACYRMTGGHFTTRVMDSKKGAKVSYVNPETGRLTDETYNTKDDELTKQDVPDNVNDRVDYQSPAGGGGGAERKQLVARCLALAAAREGEAPPSMQGLWDNNNPADNAGEGAGGSESGQRKAKAICREANKDKETATIEMSIGNPLVAAGMTFMLKGVGQFDGKWFIESARHTVGPQYDTELGVRRCLEGY